MVDVLKYGVLLVVLFAAAESYADSPGGPDDNTSPPDIIAPQTPPPPQTPPYPQSFGANTLPNFPSTFRAQPFQSTGGGRR